MLRVMRIGKSPTSGMMPWAWHAGVDSDSGAYDNIDNDADYPYGVAGYVFASSDGAEALGASDTYTVTATLDWINPDGSDALNPPKCVMVSEGARAQFVDYDGADTLGSTTADNGLGDAVEDYSSLPTYYEYVSGAYAPNSLSLQ
jgi:hypothetical protein